MFTDKELQALSNLLNRVNIQGSEAVSVVLLQQKIKKLLVEPKDETKEPNE